MSRNSSSGSRRNFFTRPVVLVVLVAALIGIGWAAYWFQPWKLATNTTVNESLPGLVEASAEGKPPGDHEAAPRVLAEGKLISHEHDTSGMVRLIEDADGNRVVRIENLETSDGPDLHVFLTDAPVLPGRDGWHVFDQGRHVDLGPLKGNRGNANYPVPSGVDIAGLNSVSVWCDRFDVSFGAAELTPVQP